jgi:hypothetical protein
MGNKANSKDFGKLRPTSSKLETLGHPNKGIEKKGPIPKTMKNKVPILKNMKSGQA